MNRLKIYNNSDNAKTEIVIPASKSYAHRYIIASALCDKLCKISNITFSKDIEATLSCIKELGASVSIENNDIYIKGPLNKKNCVLDCNESASTLRFFVPITIVNGNKVKFIGKESLLKRPLSVYTDIFDKKSINYELKSGQYFKIDGVLPSGEYCINGEISSQFITGLLYSLPLTDGNSKLIIDNELQSKPYIDMTLEVLSDAGIDIENKCYQEFIIKRKQKYKQREYTVQGDYSQAAFFMVAGIFKGNVTIKNLSKNSLQGDKAIIDFLKKMGGRISYIGENLVVEKSDLKYSGTFDVKDCPDIVPVLALACAVNDGTIILENTKRLAIKECDRAAAITDVLTKLGAKIENNKNHIKIVGVKSLNGGVVDSYNDHRIAMTEAVASLVSKNSIEIINPMSIEKSYPTFYDDFKKIGGVNYEWRMGE